MSFRLQGPISASVAVEMLTNPATRRIVQPEAILQLALRDRRVARAVLSIPPGAMWRATGEAPNLSADIALQVVGGMSLAERIMRSDNVVDAVALMVIRDSRLASIQCSDGRTLAHLAVNASYNAAIEVFGYPIIATQRSIGSTRPEDKVAAAALRTILDYIQKLSDDAQQPEAPWIGIPPNSFLHMIIRGNIVARLRRRLRANPEMASVVIDSSGATVGSIVGDISVPFWIRG